MSELTPEQVRILLHMTGLDRGPKQYRNYYASYSTGRAIDDLRALEARGLLYLGEESPGPPELGPMLCFHCTGEGIEAAWSKSRYKAKRPKEPIQ